MTDAQTYHRGDLSAALIGETAANGRAGLAELSAELVQSVACYD